MKSCTFATVIWQYSYKMTFKTLTISLFVKKQKNSYSFKKFPFLWGISRNLQKKRKECNIRESFLIPEITDKRIFILCSRHYSMSGVHMTFFFFYFSAVKTKEPTSHERGTSSQFWPSLGLVLLMAFLSGVFPEHH